MVTGVLNIIKFVVLFEVESVVRCPYYSTTFLYVLDLWNLIANRLFALD